MLLPGQRGQWPVAEAGLLGFTPRCAASPGTLSSGTGRHWGSISRQGSFSQIGGRLKGAEATDRFVRICL